MSNDLLKKLENKINSAIETIELSRMEISELKEQNDELNNRYVDWEERLSVLIEKFEKLEKEETLENNGELEDSSHKIESEENEISASNDDEVIEAISENDESEENEISVSNDDEAIEAISENDEFGDKLDVNESEELFEEESSVDELPEIDDAEEPVFGPSADSYTEAQGSTQHYA